MRRSIVSVVSIFALAALAGCGQKGPLVRPGPAAQPTQPAPAQNVPPPSAPNTNTLPTPDSGSGG
ncbi:MAG: lipoprotein [Rhodanobacteraceae bacterium]